jgi:hypothetical protein
MVKYRFGREKLRFWLKEMTVTRWCQFVKIISRRFYLRL